MNNRKYYIITIPNEHMIQALDICIGDNETQRWSLDKTKLLVKTTDTLIDEKINSGVRSTKIFPNGLTTEHTYEEVLDIMSTPEWTNPLIQENL